MTPLDKMLKSHKLSCTKRKGIDICDCGLDGAIVELANLRARIADLENKIEALQEERGDLLVIIEAIYKVIAPFVRVPFTTPDPTPITREEILAGGS